jgi:hypothetical protein
MKRFLTIAALLIATQANAQGICAGISPAGPAV